MMGEQQNQVENLDIDPKACGHVIWDKPASQCMVGGGGYFSRNGGGQLCSYPGESCSHASTEHQDNLQFSTEATKVQDETLEWGLPF